jgi:hypothetical protein
LNTVAIKSLPIVQKVLSPAFKKLLSDNTPKDTARKAVKNYAAYISTFKAASYEALDILNSPESLLKQLRGFVGFMYSQYDCKPVYDATYYVIRTLIAFTEYEIDTPQLSPLNKAVRYSDIARYQLMEQTGGRVVERHLETVDDFKDARDMNEPSLKMHTLKRKDEQTTRHVPIPHTLVTDIDQ